MIKTIIITISNKKFSFSNTINFTDKDDLKEDIEYEINNLISSMSKFKHVPKYFIRKLIDKKIYSLDVIIYTIYNTNNFSENIFVENYREFKSKPFCNNEELSSYIIETYSNNKPSKRNLVFGNENSWQIYVRREISDYDSRNSFYRIGDIVMIKGYKNPFIITWLNNNINEYNFCNTYDVFCIKNNKIQFTCDDGIHYNNIIKVIGHDLELAKTTIMDNKSEYTEEYIERIMSMKD